MLSIEPVQAQSAELEKLARTQSIVRSEIAAQACIQALAEGELR
jgi:hypothetical protein